MKNTTPVRRATENDTMPAGGRLGTVNATLDDMVTAFGTPDEVTAHPDGLDGAGKVFFIYYFMTPRGGVQVRDYWWNAHDELSIAGDNDAAGMWLARFMRDHGMKAGRSFIR